jgi:hypothetical protein
MHAAPSDKFADRNSNPCIDTTHTNFHPVKTLWQNQYLQVAETKFLSIFYSLSFLPIHETRLLNTGTWELPGSRGSKVLRPVRQGYNYDHL